MEEALNNWGPLGLASLAALGVIVFWFMQTLRHDARLQRLNIRVHVNGIRGKSTIVRYIAGALREGGIETIAKTTGSATRLIHADGSEEPIDRQGPPTIIEQIRVLKQAIQPETRALVIECMALNTEYQRISERRMIRATDGVIANVRRDHIEELGYELEDIARSLSNTVPLNAPLFTAETQPKLRNILARAAEDSGGDFIPISADEISEEELEGFGPLTFPENLALALAVVKRHGVPRDVALNGMRKSRLDPGASGIFHHKVEDRDFFWINLFGVNDVESAQINLDRINRWADSRAKIMFVLNNRADREHRTIQFAQMVAKSDYADQVLLVGENLDALQEAVKSAGLDSATAFIPTATVEPADIIAQIGASNNVIVVGLANIHTTAADHLRDGLEQDDHAWTGGRIDDERQAR